VLPLRTSRTLCHTLQPPDKCPTLSRISQTYAAHAHPLHHCLGVVQEAVQRRCAPHETVAAGLPERPRVIKIVQRAGAPSEDAAQRGAGEPPLGRIERMARIAALKDPLPLLRPRSIPPRAGKQRKHQRDERLSRSASAPVIPSDHKTCAPCASCGYRSRLHHRYRYTTSLSAADSGVQTSPLRPWIWRTSAVPLDDLKVSNFSVTGSKRNMT